MCGFTFTSGMQIKPEGYKSIQCKEKDRWSNTITILKLFLKCQEQYQTNPNNNVLQSQFSFAKYNSSVEIQSSI